MDIKFIWTGSDAKALVYYITDYVTKSSLAFYDMFALAQQGIKSIEQHRLTESVDSATEKSRRLVLRCYNMIASHQEVSGVQVASYLMNYGDHYTTHTFRNLFLISIEQYLQAERSKTRIDDTSFAHQESDGKGRIEILLNIRSMMFSRIFQIYTRKITAMVQQRPRNSSS